MLIFIFIDEQQQRQNSSTSNQPNGTLQSLYLHSHRYAAVRQIANRVQGLRRESLH